MVFHEVFLGLKLSVFTKFCTILSHLRPKSDASHEYHRYLGLSIDLTNKDKKILKSFVKDKYSSLFFRTSVDEEKKFFNDYWSLCFITIFLVKK